MPKPDRQALDASGAASDLIDEAAVDCALDAVAAARDVAISAGGRERLLIRGFAMWLFRLGRSVCVVKLKARPCVSAGAMRANHTKLA